MHRNMYDYIHLCKYKYGHVTLYVEKYTILSCITLIIIATKQLSWQQWDMQLLHLKHIYPHHNASTLQLWPPVDRIRSCGISYLTLVLSINPHPSHLTLAIWPGGGEGFTCVLRRRSPYGVLRARDCTRIAYIGQRYMQHT